MSTDRELTQEVLKSLLTYDPETGNFFWSVKSGRKIRTGRLAGNRNCNGYLVVGVKGKKYMCHRLAWLYVYGKWPTHLIDHINRVRTDNRISNLREVLPVQNSQNRNPDPKNKSGLRGVCWGKKEKKWRSQIKHAGEKIHLGVFDDKFEAYAAYLEAARKYHTHNNLVNES